MNLGLARFFQQKRQKLPVLRHKRFRVAIPVAALEKNTSAFSGWVVHVEGRDGSFSAAVKDTRTWAVCEVRVPA